MMVNGQTVKPTITGNSSEYSLVYDPPAALSSGQDVSVYISAQDLADPPNTLIEEYIFTVSLLRIVP
jgi:hypothetical protein